MFLLFSSWGFFFFFSKSLSQTARRIAGQSGIPGSVCSQWFDWSASVVNVRRVMSLLVDSTMVKPEYLESFRYVQSFQIKKDPIMKNLAFQLTVTDMQIMITCISMS